MKKRLFLWLLTTVLITCISLLSMPLPVEAAVGTINIFPNTGAAQTSVNLTGQNFTPNSSFTVTFGPGTATSGVVDAMGNISTFFIVPNLARGQYPVVVTTTGPDTSNTVYYTITSEIVLGASSGIVGILLPISGTGFTANATINILFDGTLITTVPASSSGSFTSATIIVPSSAAGVHTVTATDLSGISAVKSFTVLPTVNVTPTTVAVGDQVAINGTGFAASSSINISWDGGLVGMVNAVSNNVGSFTANLTIPASSRGQHTVRANDSSSNSASAAVTVQQKITLSPVQASTGATITVTGTGFSSSRSISITYAGASITTSPASVVTDSQGGFNASFTLPARAAGTYAVQVSDSFYSASANLQVVVKATISPVTTAASPGNVGTELTVSGIGFKPDTAVNITYANSAIGAATTNSNGNFTFTFSVPQSPAGQHSVTVSDGLTLEQFIFYMESIPPPVPAPLLPPNQTKVKQPVQFQWQSVNDPSGVTYSFQLARNANFTDIILQQDGLTSPAYTMSPEQKLQSVSKKEPYYWRARAMDGASNRSDWSAPWSFTVGFILDISGWALYTIVGIGALLLFLVGILLGKKMA